MEKEKISNFVLERYTGIVLTNAWGEQSFFYNPGRKLPRGVYFATLKDKDGENDRGSSLDREGVYRFNFGASKESYRRLFGEQPGRPPAGGVVETGHDFTQLNRILPHPVYGWMSWVCVLNPDSEVFESLLPLLDEAYALVVRKFEKRARS
ncbi:DUF6194 family protein [Microbulbifer sp.]|uniref:DUF6194 family protein n=1 Tax=Microbulbifer sp. TaxID=1908541 RepID=UPI003F418CB6